MAISVDPRLAGAEESGHQAPVPLVWTPVHSTASWTGSPAPPRVVRAALTGQGWLVATEVAGGWSTTFVPDPGATNPPGEAASGGFQVAKVEWMPQHGHPGPNPAATKPARTDAKKSHVPEHHEAPEAVHDKSAKKHRA